MPPGRWGSASLLRLGFRVKSLVQGMARQSPEDQSSAERLILDPRRMNCQSHEPLSIGGLRHLGGACARFASASLSDLWKRPSATTSPKSVSVRPRSITTTFDAEKRQAHESDNPTSLRDRTRSRDTGPGKVVDPAREREALSQSGIVSRKRGESKLPWYINDQLGIALEGDTHFELIFRDNWLQTER
jgi:hypothetical protein